jgi:hypothetical protein
VAALAGHGLPGVDADAHGERDGALGRQGQDRLPHRQRRAAGAQRMVVAGLRCAEQRHDAVARLLRDGAPALGNDVVQAVEHSIE